VLLAQLAPVSGGCERNLARVVETVRSHQEVDLAIFPELFLSGYVLDALDEVAILPTSAEIEAVREAAAAVSTAVVLGFAEAFDGSVANSVACVDRDGELVAVYRKVHLFGREREAFVSGSEAVVAELCGIPVGIMICFDVEFPELARSLARAGAKMLATASANMEPYYRNHELHVRARALENRLPHVYVNRVGEEGGLQFVGGSRVVDADGEPTAELTDARERVLSARLPHRAGGPELDYAEQVRDVPVVVYERSAVPRNAG
jgi:predicted amidohydrolase